MKTLTYSSTSTFKNCRKKYNLSYNKKLTAKDTPLYFNIGDSTHLGLEMHYNSKTEIQCLDAMRKKMYENDPNIDDMSVVLVCDMFKGYIRNYQNEPFKVIYSELEFTVKIINPDTNRFSKNYDFKGKVDGLVKENGKYWIVEHKTAKNINNLYLKALTLDTQSIGYLEALERFLGIKIEGIIYNVLLKNVPKEPRILKNGKLSTATNQNTTLELFIDKCNKLKLDINDYSDYTDWLANNRKQYFYREYLTFSQKVIDEWKQELWDLQKDISNANNQNRFYKNTRQCTNMGTCSYFDICTALDEDSIIDMNFNIKNSVHSELSKSK